MGEGVNADAKNIFLLYASAANLLSFAGYASRGVHDAVRGNARGVCSRFRLLVLSTAPLCLVELFVY
jgi:hypothetical protein